MKMMIDPPGGWRHGFPKYVDMSEFHRLQNLSDEDFMAWLVDNGYPAKEAETGWKWCRYMQVNDE